MWPSEQEEAQSPVKRYRALAALLSVVVMTCNAMAAKPNATPPPSTNAQPSPKPAERLRLKKQSIENSIRDGKLDDAIVLNRELIADTSASLEQRLSAFDSIAECLRKKGDLEQAIAAGDESLALPLNPDQKASVALRNARFYMSMTPPKAEQADTLLGGVLNNSSVTMRLRVNAYLSLTQRILNTGKKSDKKQVYELATIPLSDKGITGEDFCRVQEQIMKTAKDLKDTSTLVAAAEAIRTNASSPNTYKISATWAVAENCMEEGRTTEAERLLREPLAYPNLNENDVIAATANAGRVLEWQERCDEAIATYRSVLAKADSERARKRVNQLVADALVNFGRYEEAAQVYREAGMVMEEAKVYSRSQTPEKGRPIALRVLEDEKQPEELRRQAYEFFIKPGEEDRKIAELYLPLYTKNFAPDANMERFWTQARNAMMCADYGYALRCLEVARTTAKYKDEFLAVLYQLNALAGLGRTAEAAKLATDNAANPKFTAEQRYQTTLTAAMLTANEKPGEIDKRFSAVDTASTETRQLGDKKRADLLLKVARTAMIANKTPAAKEIHAKYEKLHIPQPTKLYKIGFSDTPVTGLSAWEHLRTAPARQLLDRQFSENMDFLLTDVATGDRGAGIGSEDPTNKKGRTEFAATCDANGIHLLFTAHDDRARDVEAKLAEAGSYEIYIAPGENQPYTCLLVNLQSGELGFFHTTYNNEQHRRVAEKPPATRCEHVFTDDGYQTSLFLAWDSFYDKLPDPNDKWDFECIHWSRSGGYSWNGTRSIHGRSTWGQLQFSISPDQMTELKRKLVFKACAKYRAEKSTDGKHQGIIDFWKDPELGDPRFYQQCLALWIAELDSFVPRVQVGMNSAEVELLFKQAVPEWNELRIKIAALRRQYLEEALLH